MPWLLPGRDPVSYDPSASTLGFTQGAISESSPYLPRGEDLNFPDLTESIRLSATGSVVVEGSASFGFKQSLAATGSITVTGVLDTLQLYFLNPRALDFYPAVFFWPPLGDRVDFPEAEEGPPDADPVAIWATTQPPSVTSLIVEVDLITIAATTAKPQVLIDAAYDPNLLSDVILFSKAPWEDGKLAGLGHDEKMPTALSVLLSGPSRYEDGPSAAYTGWDEWASDPALVKLIAPAYRDGYREEREGRGLWEHATPLKASVEETWGHGPFFYNHPTDSWLGKLPATHPPRLHEDHWQTTDFMLTPYVNYTPQAGACDFPGVFIPVRRPLRGGYAEGQHTEADRAIKLTLESQTDGELVIDSKQPAWRDAGLVWYYRRPEPPYIPPVEPPWEPPWDGHLCLIHQIKNRFMSLGLPCERLGPISIPVLKRYVVIHDISVVRLPDRTPINFSSLDILLDTNSWAWSWHGNILGRSSLDAVEPGVDDEPVTIEVSLNGHVWHLLVEDWKENRLFNSRTINVSGRGLSALLADPYRLPESGTLENSRTVVQAMEERLPEGEGWSVTWDYESAPGFPLDWVLPAGSWSWIDSSPIKSIADAMIGCGMVVVPDKAGKGLTLQPRYPTHPWHYDTVDPDLIVPDSAILGLTNARKTLTQANAVYVHGEGGVGNLARVYFSHTAGDKLAPTRTSPMITDDKAARLYGERLLASYYARSELSSVTLPMGGEFPLGSIGQLLEASISGIAHRGIINGISLHVSFEASTGASITQTLTIGDSTQNLWAKFMELVPQNPIRVGTVTASDTYHSTVQIVSGDLVTVRGSSGVGTVVYIQSGSIIGNAPTLSLSDLDIVI